MRERLRRLFPPAGRQYELYDTSVFLFAFGMVAYVIFQPPSSVTVALSAPLRVVSETELGWALVVASLVGIVCSYFPDQLFIGYLIPRIAAAFLTLNFLVAIVAIGLDCTLGEFGIHLYAPDVDTTNTLRVSILYALIFGWATRRLSRDDVA